MLAKIHLVLKWYGTDYLAWRVATISPINACRDLASSSCLELSLNGFSVTARGNKPRRFLSCIINRSSPVFVHISQFDSTARCHISNSAWRGGHAHIFQTHVTTTELSTSTSNTSTTSLLPLATCHHATGTGPRYSLSVPYQYGFYYNNHERRG